MMAIFALCYTALAPTLETTWNKPYFPVLSKGGVPSMTLMLLKRNIVRYYSDLKPNIPLRNCIGSLRSQDLCK